MHTNPEEAFLYKLEDEHGHKGKSNDDHHEQSIENEKEPFGFLVVKGKWNTVVGNKAQNH